MLSEHNRRAKLAAACRRQVQASQGPRTPNYFVGPDAAGRELNGYHFSSKNQKPHMRI